jgi:putative membrane protein
MRNTLIAIWCAAGAFLFASCGSGSGEETTTADTTSAETATVAGTDSTLTEDKQELMQFAARNNMLQVELGKLAAAQGTSDAVKTYGQNLVDWYTAKQQELQELSQQYNVSLPQQLEDEDNEHLTKLRKAEHFNEEYWNRLTEAQQDAIDEFDDGLKDVDETDASAFSVWARNTLKELRAQYEQAKGQEVELKRRDTGLNLEN